MTWQKKEIRVFSLCQIINSTGWGTEFKSTDMYISVTVWDDQLREVYSATMWKKEPMYIQGLNGIMRSLNAYIIESRRVKREVKKKKTA